MSQEYVCATAAKCRHCRSQDSMRGDADEHVEDFFEASRDGGIYLT